MPAFNHNTKPIDVAGVGHRATTLFLVTNGAGTPTSFGGAYVRSVSLGAAGIYTIILAPFVPDDLVCMGWSTTNRRVRLGAVAIDAAAKTTTLTVYSSGFGAVLSNAAFTARGSLHWKMFSGKDWTGL